MTNLNAEIAVATRAAQQAGTLILDVYRTDFSVDWKGRAQTDPVTQADRLANELLVAELQRHFPTDGIVAEESQSHSAAFGKSRVWYVDPLDGTKEFVSRNGEFSVMLGLAIDGCAVLGVVFQPTTGRLFVGDVSGGAWLMEGNSKTPLRIEHREPERASSLRLVVSRSHRSQTTDEIVRRVGVTQEMACGSVGLKVGLIAQQCADLYVHLSDKASAWDTCGPEAVLRAAGGRFTDLHGNPFVYLPSDLRARRGILACRSDVFSSVLPSIAHIAQTAGFLP
ncbi:MAG TPA: 3'(2'),5'-bisphosphate nucleotidase CysQ [Pseudomonadota bacterium]|nr:3'(2'),5'-bisphosphate nucleotidase CysQ [Pseudomonadota bacterium]